VFHLFPFLSGQTGAARAGYGMAFIPFPSQPLRRFLLESPLDIHGEGEGRTRRKPRFGAGGEI